MKDRAVGSAASHVLSEAKDPPGIVNDAANTMRQITTGTVHMSEPKRRQTVQRLISDQVLFSADHTCCICRTKGKDVQLHHIDGNPINSRVANLAVVCMDCHSRITGRRGLGQSYTAGEVAKYKRSWDKIVFDRRRIHRPQIRYKKELVSQIDLIICDILSRKPNSPRVSELLDCLWELTLWRGGPEIDSKIVEGLHHLARMSGISDPRLASLVAEKLWEMCFHFVGPEDVPMDKKDQSFVLDCIEALRTLAEFNFEFAHGRKAAISIVESCESFFEMSLWYDRRTVANAVLRTYEGALSACYEEKTLAFAYGRSALKKSLRKIRNLLDQQHPEWARQRQRIERSLNR